MAEAMYELEQGNLSEFHNAGWFFCLGFYFILQSSSSQPKAVWQLNSLGQK